MQGVWQNQDFFSDVSRMPNRYDLDQVSTDRPVCIVRTCGHCLAVNSKALDILKITEETVSPEGGEIGKENGILDGRFYDNAMDLIQDAIPVPEKEAVKQMLVAACKRLNAYGVTSCQTDDYCAFRNLPWETIHEAYHELEESGELTVRVYEQSNFTNLERLQKFVEAGHITGIGTELFKMGMQVAIHTIGDACFMCMHRRFSLITILQLWKQGLEKNCLLQVIAGKH